MSQPTFRIGGRQVGGGCPTFIIAELSANHGQEYGRAAQLVEAAAAAGADAVKLQTYTPDTMTIDAPQPWFRIAEGTLWSGRTLYDLYGEAQTPWEWHRPLQKLATELGLVFFSAPFDASAADFLAELDVAAYKIASFELVDLALIRYAAAKGKPLILSTGMATSEEIGEAVAAAREGGAKEMALLRCNSGYPASPAEMDLRTIPDMVETWGVPIGLSDHTLGVAAALVAVSLGATILEKHLTLSRAEPGPDSAFSLEPSEFRLMVESVREAERALGGVRYGPSPAEVKSLAFRRSLFVVSDVRAGELFTAENVRAIRPGDGLPPRFLGDIIGRPARTDVARGTPVRWELVG